jgi:recombination protein RecR
MPQHTQSIQTLMDELGRLPGIGGRSAERIAFHLLKTDPEDALRLADAIRDVKTKIRHCANCYNLAEDELCPICRDAETGKRDRTLICVVEQPKDLIALEETGLTRGTYHVLLGRISPLDDVGPEDLTIDRLLTRLTTDNLGEPVTEVVLALNPNLDGDATALEVANTIKAHAPDMSITRLARGLSTGSSIEFANKNMLEDAMKGRTAV